MDEGGGGSERVRPRRRSEGEVSKREEENEEGGK